MASRTAKRWRFRRFAISHTSYCAQTIVALAVAPVTEALATVYTAVLPSVHVPAPLTA
jgi:hypothetical protein